jgi:hypothetical protein
METWSSIDQSLDDERDYRSVIARSEATKQSSYAPAGAKKSYAEVAAPAAFLFCLRATRALDCFVAIGERSDAVLSNGYASQ